jgi:hypothetical protein
LNGLPAETAGRVLATAVSTRSGRAAARFASATGAQTASRVRPGASTNFERFLMLLIPTSSHGEDRRNADVVVQLLPARAIIARQ